MRLPSRLVQVSEQRRREGVRLLDVRDVRSARDHDVGRARDRGGELVTALRWCDGVVLAGDDQGGCGDRAEARADVERRERLAAGGVALGRRLDEHRPEDIHHVRVLGVEALGEPAAERRFGDDRHAALAHRCRPLHPLLGRGERGPRAAEREPVESLGGLQGEPHPDGAPDRETAERDPLEAELVEQREHVAAEVVDRVRAGRNGREAVAAPVVAHDAESLREGGHLRVPHRERGAERVAEHERRGVGRPFDDPVERHSAATRSAS